MNHLFSLFIYLIEVKMLQHAEIHFCTCSHTNIQSSNKKSNQRLSAVFDWLSKTRGFIFKSLTYRNYFFANYIAEMSAFFFVVCLVIIASAMAFNSPLKLGRGKLFLFSIFDLNLIILQLHFWVNLQWLLVLSPSHR